MALPPPVPGMVIRFHYLWSREARRGRVEGRYARPCAIVVSEVAPTSAGSRVIVAPITHSAPLEGETSLELPQAVKRHLGLDDGRSWIVLDEVNVFDWPGHDLDVNAKGKVAYGMLPPRLFLRVKQGILSAIRAGRLRQVAR